MLDVLFAFGVPADNDSGIALARREFQMRIFGEVIFCYGITDYISRDHSRIIFRVLLEIFFKNESSDRRALTMSSENKRTAVIIIFKIIVECRCYVFVGYTFESWIEASVFLPNFSSIFQADLTIERNKNISCFFIRARM